MDVKTAMRRSELFRGLNEDQLDALATISHEKTYHTNDTVFEQNAPGDGFYIVGKGQVSVMQSESNRPTIYLGEGQSFGEMALIDSARRSASIIVATNDTLIYYISTSDFTQLCENNTAIGYIMMRNIAQDLSFKLRHNVVSNN